MCILINLPKQEIFLLESTDFQRKSSVVGLRNYRTGINRNTIFSVYFSILYYIYLELCKTATTCFKLSFQKSLVSRRLNFYILFGKFHKMLRSLFYFPRSSNWHSYKKAFKVSNLHSKFPSGKDHRVPAIRDKIDSFLKGYAKRLMNSKTL